MFDPDHALTFFVFLSGVSSSAAVYYRMKYVRECEDLQRALVQVESQSDRIEELQKDIIKLRNAEPKSGRLMNIFSRESKETDARHSSLFDSTPLHLCDSDEFSGGYGGDAFSGKDFY